MINNYGYMINKSDLNPLLLKQIIDDLTMKPKINSMYNKKKEQVSFTIFQEGTTKLLLPKYYAIKKLGYPKTINTEIHDIDRINITLDGEPRKYQIEIIEQCKKHFFENNKLKSYGGGIITIPPGKGKTFIALYMLWLLKFKTLIIVHTSFLVGQWKERIKQYLPDARIGIIQGKKINIENKDIVIGMLQSISGKNYDDDIFEGFPLVIFDEVHHLGAKMFSQALLKIQAPYTIGLSATPTRKDTLEKVFFWHLGPMIYEMYAQVDNTVIVKLFNYMLSKPNIKYKKIYSGWGGKAKQINTAKMMSNITELEQRNKLILNLIKDIFPIMPPTSEQKLKYNKYKLPKLTLFNDDNLFDRNINDYSKIRIPTNYIPYKYLINYRKVLVLTERRDHLAEIEKLLIKFNPLWTDKVGYYIGGMKEHEHKASEQKSIILATYQMASEALDIKNLDTLIYATPQSAVEQSSGRIMREEVHKRENIPIIYDIVDSIDIYRYQAKKRYINYTDKEYQTEWYNVIDDIIVSGNNIFEKEININNKDDDFID